ncbi:hypothetical protein NX059_000704 [Plenodomus lindquistii]|nr:hypothetical protein NX059_000704 [Plenodomus lindquistii]
MQLADDLVAGAHFPKPTGLSCFMFDFEVFITWILSNPMESKSRKYQAAVEFKFHNMVQAPNKNQGRAWIKPHRYLAAALAFDKSITTPTESNAAFDRLQAYHDSRLEHIQLSLDRNIGVQGQ